MSELTLDEAIKHCLEMAEQNETSAIVYKNCKEIKTNMYEKLTAEKSESDCRECAADHRQLSEWLTELKELREIFAKVDTGAIKPKDYLDLLDEWAKARKLLKAAVEGMRWLNENTQDSDGSCAIRTEHGCSGCPLDINGDLFCKWKHEAEVLALIGEDGDTE